MIKAFVRATFVALLISAFIGVVPLPSPVPWAGALEAPPVFLLMWGSGNGDFSYPMGVAVDGSGNVYVADTNAHRIQKFDSTGTYLTGWGTFGAGNDEFDTPMGVAVDGSGKVYVADYGNNRIQKFDSTGTYLTGWSTFGSGEFTGPHGVAVDGSGNVYVADAANNRIQKFDSTGTYLTGWSTGNGELNVPNGVAVDGSGNVYVADTGRHRIQKFDSTGTYLTGWGTFGSANGEFNNPMGVAVDGSGNVYVADMVNNRIQKFDSTGTYLTGWGSSGSGNGEFTWPTGVAVDGSGSVYVDDYGNNRIQKFGLPAPDIEITLAADETSVTAGDPIHFHVQVTNTGNVPLTGVSVHDERVPACDASIGDLAVGAHPTIDCTFTGTLTAIGTFANTAAVESNEAPPRESNRVEVAVSAAPPSVTPPEFVRSWDNNWFATPSGLAVNQATGEVYVADAGYHRILRLTADGGYLGQWGTQGTDEGEFEAPGGVAVNQGTGEVFVVDSGNNRVQRFTAEGVYLGEWGGLNGPTGITVWPYSPLVYVADTGNNRVKAFSPEGQLFGEAPVSRPAGVAFGGGDHLHTTSLADNRVIRTTPYGVLETEWGNEGSAAGQFLNPYGVGVDGAGNVFVADTTNHRIQQFDGDGRFLAQWGSEAGDGQLVSPVSVATGPGGDVYVADYANHRVQQYDARPTRVSGTMTDSVSGDPVPDGWVAVLRTSDFSIAASAVADEFGNYTTVVAPGSYFLYVVDPTGDHAAGFHGPPTTVVVPADTVVDVDPVLVPLRGSIGGTVTEEPSGAPVGGVWAITLSGTTVAPETGTTADDQGVFRVGRLRPGNHFLAVVDPTGLHRPEFWPNSGDALGASPLAVTTGHATEADLALSTQTPIAGGSELSGTVTESGTGTPLAAVYVIALRAADYRFARGTVTDSAGGYSLDLAPGDYKVEFVDATGIHDMEWNANHPYYDIALADSVTAPTGTVDAALAARTGTMTGTVTEMVLEGVGPPIPGAWVIAIAPNGIAGGAVTDIDGTYRIEGLVPGTYRVTFADPNGGRSQEYWHNSSGFDGATPFPVTAGAIVTIDEDLGYFD